MIRVFIADEQPVLLAGLRSFFRGTEFQVVGEATNGLGLVRDIGQACPHIVLIDTNQVSFEGFTEGLLSGIGKACRWEYKVVELVPALKSAPKHSLLDTLRKFAPKRVNVRGESLKKTGGSDILTRREVEILRLIVQGNCNKEIARSLGISLDTVKEHVQNILRKTSLSDRTQAALWAVREGIASL